MIWNIYVLQKIFYIYISHHIVAYFTPFREDASAEGENLHC
jgi:hypothetical protein